MESFTILLKWQNELEDSGMGWEIGKGESVISTTNSSENWRMEQGKSSYTTLSGFYEYEKLVTF